MQKFLWWDSAITEADRGKKLTYMVTPCAELVRWTIKLHDEAASKPVEAPIPTVERDKISTWVNRAVVSSPSFSKKFPDPVSGHHFQINNLDGTGEDSLETCHACQLYNLPWPPKAL
jgi:hypothetical protein